MRVFVVLLSVWACSLSASAWAGTCGGSDSGSSSSSDSSDSGGVDFSSSDDTDTSPACSDYSDTHGYASCRSFGSWDAGSVPALNLSVGLSGGARSLARGRFRGVAEHDSGNRKVDYRMNEESAERAGYGMVNLGLSGFVSRHLYSGLHLGIGGGSVSHMMSSETLQPNGMVRFEVGGVVGAAIPMGEFQLRGEVVAGLRSTGISMTSIQGDCITDLTAWDHDLLLAPRVTLSKWLTPWTSVGVQAQTDSASFGDNFQIGVNFTGHLRAFDRQR